MLHVPAGWVENVARRGKAENAPEGSATGPPAAAADPATKVATLASFEAFTSQGSGVNATLSSLVLRPGFWRAGPRATKAYACPLDETGRALCRGGDASSKL